MGIPDHLTCLLRNLYTGQEATVRIGHGTMDWFKIGKGVRQGCILSPCVFNLCAEYIMRNAELEDSQAGIKIAKRNISNLRYADYATLMAQIEEKLKSLLMKVKEECWPKTQHLKKLRSWFLVSSLMANRWGKSGNSDRFYIWGSKITADSDCSHEIKTLAHWKKCMTNSRQHIKKAKTSLCWQSQYCQNYGFSSSHV